jgi:hypothetical protein
LSVGTGKIVNSHTNDSPSDTLLVCVRQARARSHVATIHARAARSSVCLVEVCARARGLCERDGSEQCCCSHDRGGLVDDIFTGPEQYSLWPPKISLPCKRSAGAAASLLTFSVALAAICVESRCERTHASQLCGVPRNGPRQATSQCDSIGLT